LHSFERGSFQFETSCCKVTIMDAYPSDAERAARARSIEALASQITELAGHLNAANYRFLTLIAEFDRREGWADSATHSCAHWLNWKCGIDLGAAREKVRTARALENLPKLSAAMERGELSYSKARALTRVACAGTEEYLLSIALHGTADHVEATVRHFRRCLEAEELSREAQQQKNRSVHYHWDDDGSLVLKARLPAETGALVLKALDAALQETPGKFDPIEAYLHSQATDGPVETSSGNVSAETSVDKPTRSMQRADALGLMAESFLAHGAEALSGGDRHQVVIHVSAETLRDDETGRCEVEDGPGLPAETVRRFACDASVVGIIESEHGEPLNVGRKTRSIPAALRRALDSRDGGCRFPGCTHKRFVDAHHIHHWAHGGETKPSNLVSLCRLHHRLVHESNVRIEVIDDGALRFTRPDGRSFDSVAPNHTEPLGDWRQLPAIQPSTMDIVA
jgi:Domain of unknown function (DUF222)/HNH endonuclease